MNKIFVSALAVLSFTTVAVAKDKIITSTASTGSGAPYGMGGCGVGSLVIDKNEKWAQVGASLINDYFGQIFSITSGISNCVEGGKETAMMEQEVFMTANFTSLSKEAAQGGGSHVAALAEVLGCEKADAFAKMSQERYDALFNSTEPKAVLSNFLREVKANDAVGTCEFAG